MVNLYVMVFIFIVVMATMMTEVVVVIMKIEVGGGSYDDIRGGGESVGAFVI